jgi:lipoate-protein ligase A
MLDCPVFFSSSFFNTSHTPDDEIALDTALFRALEANTGGESLRFWECPEPAVIVGASDRIDRQVHEEACIADGVPILRRISGGGAVVVGPGCLNYSLILSLDKRPELHSVTESYRLILGPIIEALNLPGLVIGGTSDIVLEDRKVSGNSQRRGRHALLHHGTLLYDFDAQWMARYLREPDRQPSYRARRNHAEFVTNLPMDANAIQEAVERTFFPSSPRRGGCADQ